MHKGKSVRRCEVACRTTRPGSHRWQSERNSQWLDKVISDIWGRDKSKDKKLVFHAVEKGNPVEGSKEGLIRLA